MNLQSLHNDYGIPIATLKLKFEEESIKEAKLRWLNTSVCRQLKPPTNKKRTLDLLSLKRNNIFKAIGILTGYWLFGKHGNWLGIITSQSCRSCGDTLRRGNNRIFSVFLSDTCVATSKNISKLFHRQPN